MLQKHPSQTVYGSYDLEFTAQPPWDAPHLARASFEGKGILLALLRMILRRRETVGPIPCMMRQSMFHTRPHILCRYRRRVNGSLCEAQHDGKTAYPDSEVMLMPVIRW